MDHLRIKMETSDLDSHIWIWRSGHLTKIQRCMTSPALAETYNSVLQLSNHRMFQDRVACIYAEMTTESQIQLS